MPPIEVYTTPYCSYCSAAKDLLRRKGATFTEIDVFNESTKDSLPTGFDGNVWLSLQKTKGKSDLYAEMRALAA